MRKRASAPSESHRKCRRKEITFHRLSEPDKGAAKLHEERDGSGYGGQPRKQFVKS